MMMTTSSTAQYSVSIIDKRYTIDVAARSRANIDLSCATGPVYSTVLLDGSIIGTTDEIKELMIPIRKEVEPMESKFPTFCDPVHRSTHHT